MSEFWMVWNPNRYVPTVKHKTFDSAKNEAMRLARSKQDQEFYVLKAVGMAVNRTAVYEKIGGKDQDEYCDEIPF